MFELKLASEVTEKTITTFQRNAVVILTGQTEAVQNKTCYRFFRMF